MEIRRDPQPLQVHVVWDPVVRWFHWINFACVLGLIAVGLAILNDDALALGNDAKILLKTVHVYFGYVLALNLLARFVWAFIGPRHARWRGILPFGTDYWRDLRAALRDLRAGRSRQYLGHDPLGRIAITLLLALLATLAITGLVLAGTDLFLPPLGHWIAASVAAPGIDPATLVPYAPTTYDAQAFAAMRAWRAPIVKVHEMAFYSLLVVAGLHILGVVVAEIRERTNLVSAMFSGRKTLSAEAVDAKSGDR